MKVFISLCVRFIYMQKPIVYAYVVSTLSTVWHMNVCAPTKQSNRLLKERYYTYHEK